MAEGLRPHWHQPIVDHVESHFDYHNDYKVTKVFYVCIIPGCQWKKCETSKCYYPPPAKSKIKILKKIRRNLATINEVVFILCIFVEPPR